MLSALKQCMVEQEIACEVCGVVYRKLRMFVRDEEQRQSIKRLMSYGMCGKCLANWLKIDALDGRIHRRGNYKVKYIRLRDGKKAGYLRGVIVVKRRWRKKKKQ